MRMRHLVVLSAIIASVGALAVAESHISDKQRATAVKARQSHMQLYSFNLATLGAMAKDEAPYDADAATDAANNLAALALFSQAGYWLPGTDNASMEDTRALPAIWAAESEVGAKAGAFVEAAVAMQTAAGTNLDALKAAMGPLGSGCGDCHELYRAPNN